MPELHTAPALSRLCGIFLDGFERVFSDFWWFYMVSQGSVQICYLKPSLTISAIFDHLHSYLPIS